LRGEITRRIRQIEKGISGMPEAMMAETLKPWR
jgi:hypothetical protein